MSKYIKRTRVTRERIGTSETKVDIYVWSGKVFNECFSYVFNAERDILSKELGKVDRDVTLEQRRWCTC